MCFQVEFRKGKLPWRYERNRDRILLYKEINTVEQLCEGLPSEMKQFGYHVQQLNYEDEPNYGKPWLSNSDFFKWKELQR